jgi:hypothetical protein
MWPFICGLGKRTAAGVAEALSGAAIGAAAGMLFGLLYGTLWGAIHGELATVLVVAARFAFAGTIAGFLVTTVGGWVGGEGGGTAGPGWEEAHGFANRRSANGGARRSGLMHEYPRYLPWSDRAGRALDTGRGSHSFPTEQPFGAGPDGAGEESSPRNAVPNRLWNEGPAERPPW